MKMLSPLDIAASILTCVRRHSTLWLLFTMLPASVLATPLPTFSDANLQACFDELAIVNNWIEAEDVDVLSCPNKRIETVVEISQLPNLVALDLSNNPIIDLPPLFAQSQTLERLNISGIELFDLAPILGLERLTHLFLNNMRIGDPNTDPNFIEQQLVDLLRDNPGVTHIGANGFTLSDPGLLFSVLSSELLVSLELGDTGISYLPVPLEQFQQLQVLDLSGNPLFELPPLYAVAQTLQRLNASGVQLYDLSPILGLQNLTHLLINDVTINDPSADALFIEQQLINVLRDNPGITHLGANGLTLSNPLTLFEALSPDLVALELSDTGLTHLPVPLDQFLNLQVLDLSANPLEDLPPLFALDATLQRLNVSGAQLYDLSPIVGLQNLTHLFLNDVLISNPYLDANAIEQQLLDLVRSNRSLTHLGVNGVSLSDPVAFFNELSPELTSLELSNTDLEYLPIPLEQFQRLQVLDLSDNPLIDLPPLFTQALTLEHLNLSGTELFDLAPVLGLQRLTHLFLNDVLITAPNSDPLFIENQLVNLVRDNRGITHLGINGIQLSDPSRLFSELSSELVSLEMSNTGLSYLPVPLEEFDHLQILDLSHNPLVDLPPLFALQESLKRLDISGNELFDLSLLVGLQGLTHLGLNDVLIFSPDADSVIIEQQLVDLLRENRRITHLGINGFALSNPAALFNELSVNLVSLELSGTGLDHLPVALDQFLRLQVLDLSHNPLVDLPPLFAQERTLERLNLSGIELDDLSAVLGLQRLTHLSLNDLNFGQADAEIIEKQLINLLNYNPAITHLGINGFTLNNPTAVLNEVSTNAVSLELSDIGLEFVPVPLDQFSRLQILDLSDNPLVDLPPLFAQALTLERLNISGIELIDLSPIMGLQRLTHLFLNDVAYIGSTTTFLQDQMASLLRDNPGITHFGVNGFVFADSTPVFNALSVNIESLELSRTGVAFSPVPLDQYRQLVTLDLSENDITDISWLMVDLPSLKTLNLTGNRAIACADLDLLAALLGPDVELLRPICIAEPEYCAASGRNTSFEWIAGVRVGNIGNSSSSDGGYGDFTDVVFTAVGGETTPLTLVPGFSNNSYVENWSVWIDYNKNGVFEPSEKVLDQSSNTGITIKLAVPVWLQGSSTRMRVAMRWGGLPSPCGSYTYGEVEDYTISITP